ncbi:TIGR03619 family F420-dependent LLM class oxidoreductase [Phytohabitans kaempferiae]|uniref:TIGR03619 family F420-dependent LLM class oxidoreductase n=1 Tax=Phytohabitans kaempferiae TaxID=1620943 RepID=A0ABV6MF96_9ACTN
MLVGVSTPVVAFARGRSAEWERHAGIDEVAAVAVHADRLGYHHLTCGEHVAVPRGATTWSGAERGTTYWDPLATFGFLAARTSRIRLATNVLVLGYHHPLALAKRYGTLDRVSGGRVILGVGIGTLRAEFDLLGAPFAGRGRRADDAIRALRVALSTPEPAYAGDYYSFSGLILDPAPLQKRIPLWVGGSSLAAVRRAVAFADGWTVALGVGLDRLRALLGAVDPPPGFEVVVRPESPLDPIAEPQRTLDQVGALGEAGATMITAVVEHGSLPHYLDQLGSLAELVGLDPAPAVQVNGGG